MRNRAPPALTDRSLSFGISARRVACRAGATLAETIAAWRTDGAGCRVPLFRLRGAALEDCRALDHWLPSRQSIARTGRRARLAPGGDRLQASAAPSSRPSSNSGRQTQAL